MTAARLWIALPLCCLALTGCKGKSKKYYRAGVETLGMAPGAAADATGEAAGAAAADRYDVQSASYELLLSAPGPYALPPQRGHPATRNYTLLRGTVTERLVTTRSTGEQSVTYETTVYLTVDQVDPRYPKGASMEEFVRGYSVGFEDGQVAPADTTAGRAFFDPKYKQWGVTVTGRSWPVELHVPVHGQGVVVVPIGVRAQ